MTKFYRRCTQQCQREKSQFCTVPDSPANLTKQELLAVRSMKMPREPILVTEKWRRKIFSALRGSGMIDATCLYALPSAASCARATSVSWLRHWCQGKISMETWPLPSLYGSPLESTTTFKCLGLTTASDVSWTTHIDNICSKAKCILRLVYRHFL